MAVRPSWKGYLRLSLVSVPVQAYTTAAPEHGEIHFHQLHKGCNRRIKYQKVYPEHGELARDEIVSGYEYAKGQYVIIEDSERAQAHARSEHAVTIDKFVPIDAVDPTLFEGRNYYLLPDGAAGEKPYALLYRAMSDEHRAAVAQMALSGRDLLVLVRPGEKLLTLSVLNFPEQLREPDEFEELAPDVTVSSSETKLARTLIESIASDEVDLSQYQDSYTQKLREIIEAKVSGQAIIAPPEEQEAPVVNLMDALRRSLAHSRSDQRGKPRKPRVAHQTRARKKA